MSELSEFLPSNEVHLWVTRPRILQDGELLERYAALLSDSERGRQQRYRFARHRHDDLVSRALVRTSLGHYLAMPPAELRFASGDRGKPYLVNPPVPLEFNLSHTEDFIVCAVAGTRAVGVDVEWLQRRSDTAALARRYFSERENALLLDLAGERQRDRFFDYWTLKESYIKACGQGLAIPLRHVSFEIGESADEFINDQIELRFVPGRDDRPDDWCSWLIRPHRDYRMALTVRVRAEPRPRVRFFVSVPLLSTQEVSLPLSPDPGPSRPEAPRQG
ncbi:MAG: 4'-phosphopantetheinyl transferase superfamily protein [Gammaproteobacteria bacterium]